MTGLLTRWRPAARPLPRRAQPFSPWLRSAAPLGKPADSDRRPGRAVFGRRLPDPSGLLGGLPVVSRAPPADRDHHRRGPGGPVPTWARPSAATSPRPTPSLWLFLVNVAPGILACGIGYALLPRAAGERGLLKTLDWASLAALAVALACLEILLKEAPSGAGSGPGAGPAGTLRSAGPALHRPPAPARPAARQPSAVPPARSRRPARRPASCSIGLFGSVYLMPVFFGLVREHGALTIGLIMLVTGCAQLLTAPITVRLERDASTPGCFPPWASPALPSGLGSAPSRPARPTSTRCSGPRRSAPRSCSA